MTDGLKDRHRAAIIATIAANDRVERAVLFGSRATGTHSVSSDVDIALIGDRLTLTDQARLAAALDEIPMAQEIDLVLYDSIQDETLRKHIRYQSAEWYAKPIHGEANRGTSGDACTWPIMSLRQAGVSLIDCEHRTPPATNDGYPYVGIPQIKNGRVDLDSARPIAEEHFRDWTRKANPQPFDIILSRRCNPGETGFVSPGLGEFAVGQNLVLLRSDGEKIIKPFLRWLSRGPEWWAQVEKYINAGAVFDSLTCAEIPEFRLPIPPLSDQHAIAHILGTLDDKIELNRRMNATLEAMARALFKSWFVDFDPVRAKTDGRSRFLPAAIWDLFPCSFGGDGRPVGWMERSIYDFAEVVYGAPFASNQFNARQRGLPLIRIRDLTTHEPRVWTEQVHRKGHRIEPGDIVVGMDGEFRLHVWKGPGAWLNQRVCHFEPKSGVPRAYLSVALSEPLASFERGKVGTTVIHLGKSDIDTFQMLHPSQRLLGVFGRIAEPLLDRTVANALESRALAQTRDSLLPKLMSGDIRASQAEKIVEVAM